MNTRLTAAEARERKRELTDNFREMVELAKSGGFRAFIIAGDLFDTERISEKLKRTVLDIISGAPDIFFLYLTGNHEKAALTSAESLPKNLLLFGPTWTYYVIDGVAFAGRETTSPDMFEEIKKPNQAHTLIAILHGELRDHSDRGGVIGTKELADTDINYLALGHYHSFIEKRISRSTVAVYSGTPSGRGFDESGDKGFIELTANGQNVNYTFHKTHGRKFHIIDISLDDVETTGELSEKISHACRDIESNSFVRIRLTGHRPPETAFDTDAIKRSLSARFYYLEIQDEARLKIDPEDYRYDKTLKGEFIRLVSSDSTLTEAERDEIIKTGIKALLGERFDEE